ncbi:MAG TPA: alanine racemase [Burkholderiales bacterium]|nr:alanine racemase [Burkholderiales bacterium]
MHNTIIEIDSKQFIKNLQTIRKQINNLKFCLPVKANAYGHGLVGMCLIAEPYIDYFAVACLEEGQKLRQNGIVKPILVFGGFSEEEIPDLITQNLEITISSHYKAQLVIKYCKAKKINCKVHIKVDTGMNRIGVRLENAMKLIHEILNTKELNLIGVYSHFASSDSIDQGFSLMQLKNFTKLVQDIKSINPNIICHLANSGGIINYPDSYFDMVRPGILAYGYLPIQPIHNQFKEIKPCFSLKSKVIYFKVVAKNQIISYNQSYITKKDTRVVTIPIGYGDGYRRMLTNIGEVLIRGNKYKVAGIICMDMFMVDIGNSESYVGDEVILIGKQNEEEITLESIAQKCNTIINEILVGFNERIPRVYF